MRSRLVLAALALALVAAACGGGGDDGDSASGDQTTLPGDEGEASDSGGNGGGSSDVDCAAVIDATQGLGLALQLLAQLRSLDQYALIKDGTLNLDPAATLADIDTLRALDGVEIPDGYGTVDEVLDTYEEAATLAQENLAVDDPFTEAKGDELVALTADVPAFLKGQVTIGFALDAAGCK